VWSSIFFAVLVLSGQAAQASAPWPAQPQAQPAADTRPVLWRQLRAGMSPAEVLAALTAMGIRAETGIDPETHRPFVATRQSVREAERTAEVAFGFVDDRLFYVEVNWARFIGGRPRIERSSFLRIANHLQQQFGPPVAIDPDFRVTNVQRAAYAVSAHARFEHDGIRADVTGSDTISSMIPDVPEFVDVRFWRIADAEAFEADRARKVPTPEAATEQPGK
jgi:hypothetical protein